MMFWLEEYGLLMDGDFCEVVTVDWDVFDVDTVDWDVWLYCCGIMIWDAVWEEPASFTIWLLTVFWLVVEIDDWAVGTETDWVLTVFVITGWVNWLGCWLLAGSTLDCLTDWLVCWFEAVLVYWICCFWI